MNPDQNTVMPPVMQPGVTDYNNANAVQQPPVGGGANMNNTFYQKPIQPGRHNSDMATMIIMVVLAAFAIGGVFFGVITLITKNQEISALNETIAAQENQLGNNTTIGTTEPGNVLPEDYIYVGEWGIKIKVPDNLHSVGYSYTPSSNDAMLAIYGVDGETERVPEYISALSAKSSGLGFVVRNVAGYGIPVDGQLVFSRGGYDYYYVPSMMNGLGGEDSDLVSKSRNMIVGMISNPENYSEI